MYETGDQVEIQITGQIGKYTAEVVEGGTPDRPYLKVVGDESWSSWTLKPGDYIITNQTPTQ